MTQALKYADQLVDWLVQKTGDLVLCILILVVGFKIVGAVRRLLRKTFDRHNMDQSVATFLLSFVDIGLKNDGLIHISKMSTHKVKHALDICHVGDILDVYVY